ncbi:MGMT family protein [Ruminococcaceae bacterium OttesenSCG-928-I18]|nr:MGMT family protein [Ruminococcaceae bacterium OttesenSCG-928-I18]
MTEHVEDGKRGCGRFVYTGKRRSVDGGFDKRIYDLADLVPEGKVTTYGQLALLAGRPNWARRAGRALRYAPEDRPCHRVVNSTGRLVPGWAEQREMLAKEGVWFKENGCVDMKRHRMKAEEWLAILERDST